MHRTTRVALAAAALATLTACIPLPPPITTQAAQPSSTSSPVESSAAPEPTEEIAPTTPAPEPSVEPAAAAEPEPAPPAEPALTIAQQNAVGSAESYLDFMHFSRSGLIHQLEYEGYANADATFAVDSLNVDWNMQAAGSAQDYLDFMAFSRQGLLEQLLYEGYSQSEAEYGVAAVGY